MSETEIVILNALFSGSGEYDHDVEEGYFDREDISERELTGCYL